MDQGGALKAVVQIVSSSAEADVIVAQGLANFIELRALVISNEGASASRIDFKDGASGTVIARAYLPIASTIELTFPEGTCRLSENTKLVAQLVSATITVNIAAYARRLSVR